MSNYDNYTAETARDKVSAYDESVWRKEVTRIIAKIDEAAEKGKRQLTIFTPDASIVATVMRDLCDRGFDYAYSSDNTILITW